MNFEEYFRKEVAEGKTEFRLRADVGEKTKTVTFYVHPLDKNGQTFDGHVVGEKVENTNGESS